MTIDPNRLNPVNRYICAVIRRTRHAKGLTVEEMARRTGIPLGSYSSLETGRYRMNLENLFRIINVLGLTITEVWPNSGKMRSRKQVTAAFVRQQIEEATEAFPPPLALDDVLDAVCQACRLSRQQLSSPSRDRRLSQARAVATLLVREIPHLTLVELSHALRRDVSSLSHCLRRMDEDRRESLSERLNQVRELLEERGEARERDAKGSASFR